MVTFHSYVRWSEAPEFSVFLSRTGRAVRSVVNVWEKCNPQDTDASTLNPTVSPDIHQFTHYESTIESNSFKFHVPLIGLVWGKIGSGKPYFEWSSPWFPTWLSLRDPIPDVLLPSYHRQPEVIEHIAAELQEPEMEKAATQARRFWDVSCEVHILWCHTANELRGILVCVYIYIYICNAL